jgi:hypothetical protein
MTTLADAKSTADDVRKEIGGAASVGVAVCGRGMVATEGDMRDFSERGPACDGRTCTAARLHR